MAPLPSRRGWRAPARPPPESAGDGRPGPIEPEGQGTPVGGDDQVGSAHGGDPTGRDRAPGGPRWPDGRPPPTAARPGRPRLLQGHGPGPRRGRGLAGAAAGASWTCDECPLSDGGEGFADVLGGAGSGPATDPGRWIETTVTGPLGRPGGGPLVPPGRPGRDRVGRRLGAAPGRGAGRATIRWPPPPGARVSSSPPPWPPGPGGFWSGVGGSATTDGGRGAVEAIDEAGGLDGAEVVVACDVQTLFVDAAEVFGPQKGATPEQVVVLRRRLEDLAVAYRDRSGLDDRPGPGRRGRRGPRRGTGRPRGPPRPRFRRGGRGRRSAGPPGPGRPGDHRRGPSRRLLLGREGGGRRPPAWPAGPGCPFWWWPARSGPGGASAVSRWSTSRLATARARSLADPVGCVADAVARPSAPLIGPLPA